MHVRLAARTLLDAVDVDQGVRDIGIWQPPLCILHGRENQPGSRSAGPAGAQTQPVLQHLRRAWRKVGRSSLCSSQRKMSGHSQELYSEMLKTTPSALQQPLSAFAHSAHCSAVETPLWPKSAGQQPGAGACMVQLLCTAACQQDDL